MRTEVFILCSLFHVLQDSESCWNLLPTHELHSRGVLYHASHDDLQLMDPHLGRYRYVVITDHHYCTNWIVNFQRHKVMKPLQVENHSDTLSASASLFSGTNADTITQACNWGLDLLPVD